MSELTYSEIFADPENTYRLAMERVPRARDAEFIAIRELLSLGEVSTLVDIPAGGGYLKQHLPKHIHYTGLEFSHGFSHGNNLVKHCTEASLPLANESQSAVVSLAAAHHLENRSAFYTEVARILEPKGCFILADVEQSSKIDWFLNTFVNQWNSQGHHGRFLDRKEESDTLRDCGFETEFTRRDFFWRFEDRSQMLSFARQLFRLDLNPSDNELLSALERLGISEEQDQTRLLWSLCCFIAQKSSRN
ncbi:MAG: class I SAM-dependent methyltransferase [Pseudomonadota bacterium]